MKCIIPCTLVLAFSLLLSLSATPSLAEDVTYPGDPLQDITGSDGTDLAPSGVYDGAWGGTSSSLLNNSVTLNSGTVVDVFGAFTDTSGAAVTNNQVFIKDGTIDNEVYGSFSISGDSTPIPCHTNCLEALL